jgi:hypothetical protein
VVAEARGLDVTLDAYSRVACIDFEDRLLFQASRATLEADLRVALHDGHVEVALGAFDTALEDMEVDTSVLDAALAFGLEEEIQTSLQTALAEVVATQIESNLNPMLEQFDVEPFLFETLGHRVEVELRPDRLDLGDEGADFSAAIAVRFPDLAGTPVVYSPDPPLGDLGGRPGDLGLGVADDVANGFLSVLWSARALDFSLPVDVEAARRFNIDHLEFVPLLPPVLQTVDGAVARVAIGDCLVRIVDEAQNVVAEAAVSGSLGLQARVVEGGQIEAEAVAPVVWLGLVNADGSTSNSVRLYDELSELVIERLTPYLNQAVAAMPRLRLRDVSLLSPQVDGAPGYLLMGATLTER